MAGLLFILMLRAVAALANSGDFCRASYLNPGQTCWSGTGYSVEETEGWDSPGGGVGNCNGVGNSGSGAWYGSACIGDGSGYDAVYCTSACSGINGDPFVHDHSAFYADYFTGWAEWA